MFKKLKFAVVAVVAGVCLAGVCANSSFVCAKEGVNIYDRFADESVVDENGNETKLFFVADSPCVFKGAVLNEFLVAENKDGEQFKNFDEVALRFFDVNGNLVLESEWSKAKVDGLGLKMCELFLNLDRLQDDQTYTIKIYGRDASGSESFVGKRQFHKKNIKEYENDLIKHNEEENRVSETHIEDYVVNKDGKKVSDWLNICYVDSFDGDYLGVASISLQSSNNGRFHDSVFFGHDNIRVEFFDESGKHVLTKNAVCKHDGLVKCHQSNGFRVNKFELEFGKSYNLKFYDENQPSSDENLLGTIRLQFSQSKKSSNLNDFKFFTDANGVDGVSSLNVRSGSTGERISDRLRFTFVRQLVGSGVDDEIKVECLSNSNNSDSVFKGCESLIVDVVDGNGNVVLSKKTGSDQVFEGLNVVKSKMFKIEPGELGFDEKYDLKFYNGNDEQRMNLLAYYSGFAHHGRLGVRSELVIE